MVRVKDCILYFQFYYFYVFDQYVDGFSIFIFIGVWRESWIYNNCVVELYCVFDNYLG